MPSIGRSGRAGLGIGISLPPDAIPRPRSILLDSWREGYVSFDDLENTPIDGSPLLQDIEASTGDALRRAPGIVLVEDVDPRSLAWLFEHAAAAFASKLIAIDPPFIGEKYTGAFAFTNEGIAATGNAGWNACDVAGILLFSNGTTATYLRDWATGAITDITLQIIAQTFGNAFGRTFAGAVTGVPGLEGLQINWNAASGDPADWTGLGSGSTILVNNQLEADRIVAIRPLGFDVLAVCCRKNLWLGYPTGDAFEPADFRVRFPGVGFVSERTVCITPDGIIGLSDAGVVLFNINEAKLISGKINNLLLPLNYAQMSAYYAIYNEPQRRYQLYTPEGLWVYELEDVLQQRPARWFFRGYAGESAAMFTAQSGNFFWNTIPGTWLDWDITWNEATISELNTPAAVYVGSGSQLGIEQYNVESYFDTPQDSYWVSKQSDEQATDVVSTQAVEVEYTSTADSVLTLSMLDGDGAAVGATPKTLPNSNGQRITRMIWFVISGIGTRLKLGITSGSPEIYRVRHVVNQQAPSRVAL